ncbi:unnamed protein product [Effrenium voratum]|nr:unnamed protein product [Effrenium voratum]
MARLSTAAEQVQCTLMPCLCCKALAAAEATCRDLQKLIATGDFWSQCFHVALPDFELAGDFLGTLTKEGDTESRAQLKRLLGTFWALTVKDQSLIDLQGMRLPLTSSVARQLLSKVEQAKAKTRRLCEGCAADDRILILAFIPGSLSHFCPLPIPVSKECRDECYCDTSVWHPVGK